MPSAQPALRASRTSRQFRIAMRAAQSTRILGRAFATQAHIRTRVQPDRSLQIQLPPTRTPRRPSAWQYRLSSRQYQERMEAKSARAVRLELQLLSQAFFDDTSEISVEHHSLAAGWLTRIQTVFRNALALCQAAHLSNLKAFDKKIADLCLTQPDPNLASHSEYPRALGSHIRISGAAMVPG